MDFINKVKFLKRELFNIFQINLTIKISGLNIYNWGKRVSKPLGEVIKNISLLYGTSTHYLIKDNCLIEPFLNKLDNNVCDILNKYEK